MKHDKKKTHNQHIDYGYIFLFYVHYGLSNRQVLVVVSNLGIYKRPQDYKLQDSRDHIRLAH